MSNEERNEAITALLELGRQTTELLERYGEFEFPEETATLQKTITDLRDGKISVEEADAITEEFDEGLSRSTRNSGDPSPITALDAENEAKAKGLPLAAQLLARDAAMRCGEGLTKEQWIINILQGHAENEPAQLRCLKHIVAIWSDGPWPWPKEGWRKAEEIK